MSINDAAFSLSNRMEEVISLCANQLLFYFSIHLYVCSFPSFSSRSLLTWESSYFPSALFRFISFGFPAKFSNHFLGLYIHICVCEFFWLVYFLKIYCLNNFQSVAEFCPFSPDCSVHVISFSRSLSASPDNHCLLFCWNNQRMSVGWRSISSIFMFFLQVLYFFKDCINYLIWYWLLQ